MSGNVHKVTNCSTCSEVGSPRLLLPPLEARWARAQTVTRVPLHLWAGPMPSMRRTPRGPSVIPVVNFESLAPKSTAVTELGAHRPAVHIGHIWYVVHCTVDEGGLPMP